MRQEGIGELVGGIECGNWPVYTLFGVNLASDFPFASNLIESTLSPDLAFTCVQAPPLSEDWNDARPAYPSSSGPDDGESATCLHRLGGCDVLRYSRLADFYIFSDRITCHTLGEAQNYLLEIRLLGQALSYWLERGGTPTLHASSIVIGGRAVGFLSYRRGGKSTVAATFVQAGYPLLADDILPVEECAGAFLGRPGYPQMRLWPEEAAYFFGDYRHLELVHPDYSKRRVRVGADGFGSFYGSPLTLDRLYVLQRASGAAEQADIQITPVSPRDAVIELVRHSFSSEIVEAAGLQPRRLRFFARMARQVPVRRVQYPSGFQHLSRTRDAILEDLKGLR